MWVSTVYKSAYLYKSPHPHYCITIRRNNFNPSWRLKCNHSEGKIALTLKDSPLSPCPCHPHSPARASLLYSSWEWLGKTPQGGWKMDICSPWKETTWNDNHTLTFSPSLAVFWLFFPEWLRITTMWHHRLSQNSLVLCPVSCCGRHYRMLPNID